MTTWFRHGLRCVSSLALSLLPSCTPDDEHAGFGVIPRASAHIVQDAPVVDCQGQLPDCNRGKLSITDVRRDGDRIGVLVLQDGSRLIHLYLSDDKGKTFRQAAIGGDLLEQYIWSGGKLQLVLHEGRAWLLIQTAELAGGGTAERMRLAEFDLENQRLGELWLDAFLPVGAAAIDDAGRLTVVADNSDLRGGPLSFAITAFDLKTFTTTPSQTLCEGGACFGIVWRTSDGGHEWQGFGELPNAPGIAGSVCRYVYRFNHAANMSTPYSEQNCVPFAQWPAGNRTGTDRQQELSPVGGGDLHVVYEEGGKSFARTITSATSTSAAAISPAIELGHGRPGSPYGFSARPRLSGFVPITRPARNNAGSTLVRVHADGRAEEVDFPPYPCEGECGDEGTRSDYGAIAWIEPLEDDAYLVFWIIDALPDANRHEVLYAERVQATYGAIRADVPESGTENPGDAGAEPDEVSPLPAYPNAKAAAGFMRACVQAELCGLDELNACLSKYSSISAYSSPNAEAARKKIIDAAKTLDCNQLKAALPSADCMNTCIPAGGVCTADGCDFGPAEDATTCAGRLAGYYCSAGRVIACNGLGEPSVTKDCTNVGLTCKDSSGAGNPAGAASCVPPEPCDELQFSCDGDVLHGCKSYAHCGDFGQTCAERGCETPNVEAEDARCFWGSDRPICAGDYILHCMGNRRHYTSCAEAGFAGGCQSVQFGAVCAK